MLLTIHVSLKSTTSEMDLKSLFFQNLMAQGKIDSTSIPCYGQILGLLGSDFVHCSSRYT